MEAEKVCTNISQTRTSACVPAPLSSMQMKNPQFPAAVLGTEINASEMKYQLSSHFAANESHSIIKETRASTESGRKTGAIAKTQMGTNLLHFWKHLS